MKLIMNNKTIFSLFFLFTISAFCQRSGKDSLFVKLETSTVHRYNGTGSTHYSSSEYFYKLGSNAEFLRIGDGKEFEKIVRLFPDSYRAYLNAKSAGKKVKAIGLLKIVSGLAAGSAAFGAALSFSNQKSKNAFMLSGLAVSGFIGFSVCKSNVKKKAREARKYLDDSVEYYNTNISHK